MKLDKIHYKIIIFYYDCHNLKVMLYACVMLRSLLYLMLCLSLCLCLYKMD